MGRKTDLRMLAAVRASQGQADFELSSCRECS